MRSRAGHPSSMTSSDGRDWRAAVHLIPLTIDPQTPSEGEQLIFEHLAADEAHPVWTVLHSQDIARHRRQMEGEIDFLIVAPGLGVLVLEVKGCRRLRREHGFWYYGGDIEGRARSPFKQAAEAMHSVRERLVRHRPHLADVLFWSAVCFPFIELTDESEEWNPRQVVDKIRLDQRAIADCLTSVVQQARRRAAELRMPWFDQAVGEPSPEHCDEIVQALRPDFELFESPKARAKRVDEEILHYTEERFEAARRSHAAGKSVLFLSHHPSAHDRRRRELGEGLAAGRQSLPGRGSARRSRRAFARERGRSLAGGTGEPRRRERRVCARR